MQNKTPATPRPPPPKAALDSVVRTSQHDDLPYRPNRGTPDESSREQVALNLIEKPGQRSHRYECACGEAPAPDGICPQVGDNNLDLFNWEDQ